MGSKNKLKRFKENENFNNVFQPSREELLSGNFKYKGSWANKVFNNSNPITLELGCGKGEYSYKFKNDISNSKLIVMQETGHVPMEEKPLESLKFVIDFLDN